MDWENEQYVRLYTRDTTNWKRTNWEGKAVLPLLLRKVDMSGALDLEGLEPWESVALHTELPEHVVRPGVAKLLELGTIQVRGKVLVFPNHIPAQTATKSDKLRQKESRDRRALGIHVKSQGVTEESRDVTNESRGVSPPSQPVTSGHEQSQPVTSGHSLLCSALPCSTLLCSTHTESAGAPEQGQRSDPEQTETRPKPPAPAAPPANDQRPAQSRFDHFAHRDAMSHSQSVQSRFRGLYLARYQTEPGMGGRNVGDFHTRLATTAAAQGREQLALLEEVFGKWADDKADPQHGGPPGTDEASSFAAFVARFDRYAARGLKPVGTDTSKGYTEGSPASAFPTTRKSADELYGKRIEQQPPPRRGGTRG